MKFRSVSILMCFCLCSTMLFAESRESLSEAGKIADKLQLRYARLEGLAAEFSQSLINPKMGTSMTETGRLLIKKGGKIRWDYRNPEKKLFICDGRNCYFYLPEDEVVQVIDMEKYDLGSTPMSFLLGVGDIRRDFEISFYRNPDSGLEDKCCHLLLLKPKKEEESFDYLVLSVDKNTLLIRRLVVIDLLGNQTDYFFKSFRELPSVDDNRFIFNIPDGVEIIRLED